MSAKLGICICARTTARIRRHGDKEHKEHSPKIRRQTNLCMLVDCYAFICFICVCVCSCVYGICVHKRMSAWLRTRVHRHFAGISYSPETSESRACDGDGNGQSISWVCFYFCVRYFETTHHFCPSSFPFSFPVAG